MRFRGLMYLLHHTMLQHLPFGDFTPYIFAEINAERSMDKNENILYSLPLSHCGLIGEVNAV